MFASLPLRRSVRLVFAHALSAAVFLLLLMSVAAAQEDLRFDISLARTGPFLVAEPIVVEFKLTNISPEIQRKAIDVSRPTLQNALSVALMSGDKVMKYGGVRIDPYIPESRAIRSGESFSATENIARYYHFSKPGKYTVRAVYPNAIYVNGSRPNLCYSNKLTFEVIEPNGAFSKAYSAVVAHPDGTRGLRVTWRLFTHTTGKVTGLYACQESAEGRLSTSAFATLGPIGAEAPLSCLVDRRGVLHVLYKKPGDRRDVYVYDQVGHRIVFDPYWQLKDPPEPSDVVVKRVGLYRPKKGAHLRLEADVRIEGGEEVKPGQ